MIESPLNPLYIYVDGSCLGNQNVTSETPAGWSFVVIKGDSGLGKGSGNIIKESYGKVITERDNLEFIGAEVGSNNTAELSAFVHCLKWALIQGDDQELIIRTDSNYAGNIVEGNWKAKSNKAIAKLSQELWNEVKMMRKLSWKHIRAHNGHRWNERADHLAIRAAQNTAPVPIDFWKPGLR